jgi:hypothetical protein
VEAQVLLDASRLSEAAQRSGEGKRTTLAVRGRSGFQVSGWSKTSTPPNCAAFLFSVKQTRFRQAPESACTVRTGHRWRAIEVAVERGVDIPMMK